MTDLRTRLRGSDPARDTRPLDDAEQSAIRHAMHAARPPARPSRAWTVGALAVAAAAAGIVTLLVLMPAPTSSVPASPTVPVPAIPTIASPVEQPVPTVAEVRKPQQKKRVVPKPAPPVEEEAQVETRQVRFVTANGTQVLWTLRSTQEGA